MAKEETKKEVKKETEAEATKRVQETAPEPIEEGVKEGYKSPERIIFREEFEKSLKWIDERIANTNYLMGVIVVVLLVGLLACLFAVFAMFQQAQLSNKQLDFKDSIDNETKAVNDLKEEVKNLNSSIKQIKSTPTITTPLNP